MSLGDDSEEEVMPASLEDNYVNVDTDENGETQAAHASSEFMFVIYGVACCASHDCISHIFSLMIFTTHFKMVMQPNKHQTLDVNNLNNQIIQEASVDWN
eukprot:scaffold69794_cov54-Cyclotella_meneghiniana.AAC.2